jgi:hypothetical protein
MMKPLSLGLASGWLNAFIGWNVVPQFLDRHIPRHTTRMKAISVGGRKRIDFVHVSDHQKLSVSDGNQCIFDANEAFVEFRIHE